MSDTKKKFNLPAYIQTPFFVYICDSLSEKEKRLFSHLYSYYTAGKTIKASNAYYAALLGVVPRTVQGILESLENKGWIIRHISTQSKNQSKRIIEITKKGNGLIFYDDEPETLEVGSRSNDHGGHDPMITPVTIKRSPNIKVDTKVNNTTTAASKVVESISSSISCKSILEDEVSESQPIVSGPIQEHTYQDEDIIVGLSRLLRLGFSAKDTDDLHNLYINNLDLLKQAIDYIDFDVQVNKRKEKLDIEVRNYFMPTLRKGHGLNAPAGFYKSNSKNPENKKNHERDLNKEVYLKYFDDEKAKWYLSLSRHEQLQMGLSVNDKSVSDNFANLIWPAISDDLKRKLEA